jgi:hypothetical protein
VGVESLNGTPLVLLAPKKDSAAAASDDVSLAVSGVYTILYSGNHRIAQSVVPFYSCCVPRVGTVACPLSDSLLPEQIGT